MGRGGSLEREAYWRGVMADQESSGLSISAFCRSRDISPASFFSWRRKLTQRRAARLAGKFVAIDIAPAPAASHPVRHDFEVVLTSGRRVVVPVGFCADSLEKLLGVLENVREQTSC